MRRSINFAAKIILNTANTSEDSKGSASVQRDTVPVLFSPLSLWDTDKWHLTFFSSFSRGHYQVTGFAVFCSFLRENVWFCHIQLIFLSCTIPSQFWYLTAHQYSAHAVPPLPGTWSKQLTEVIQRHFLKSKDIKYSSKMHFCQKKKKVWIIQQKWNKSYVTLYLTWQNFLNSTEERAYSYLGKIRLILQTFFEFPGLDTWQSGCVRKGEMKLILYNWELSLWCCALSGLHSYCVFFFVCFFHQKSHLIFVFPSHIYIAV